MTDRTARIPVRVPADLAPYVPEYLDAIQTDLDQVVVALAHDDFGPLWTLGHNLKGNGRSFGFDRIGMIGAELERAAEARDRSRAMECVDALRDYLGRVELIPDAGANS